MNIRKKIPKLMSVFLSFAMTFSNVLPAYAVESVTVEKSVDDESGWTMDEGNFEEIEVTYTQSSSYFVTIPKTIALDGWKQSTYSVKVSGDIGADQCVYVAPIDEIPDTESTDFYMKDQATDNKKADVVATVTQNKLHWNSAEVSEGYGQNDNLVSAPDLTAGTWKGIFQMEIRLETHTSHIHDYTETITKEPTCTEAGEKTYTCDCGDSYTEVIPAAGHNYVDGECTGCGEKDPDYHEHNYAETITKEPTCTETGEKTYTCDCGDSYTEVIPATGHNYVDGECEHCGEKDPDYHEHNYTEEITKEPSCTEEGEKRYTCECGDSYTEVIPKTEHHYGDDDKCTECGEFNPNHIHNYEPYKLNVLPTNVQFKNSSYSKADATAWHLVRSTEEYDEYACANIHPGYNRKGDLTLTCDLTLPEEYEGTFDYPYYYSVNYTQNKTYKYCTVLYINNNLLYKFTSYSDSTGAGSFRADKTTSLSAGVNTFTARFMTYNNYSLNSRKIIHMT